MTKEELEKEAEERYKEHLADPNYYESSEEESYLHGFQEGAEFGYNKAMKEIGDKQLTKAKKILTKLLEEEKKNMYWEMNGSDKSSYYEVRKQAEQFLEENEE